MARAIPQGRHRLRNRHLCSQRSGPDRSRRRPAGRGLQRTYQLEGSRIGRVRCRNEPQRRVVPGRRRTAISVGAAGDGRRLAHRLRPNTWGTSVWNAMFEHTDTPTVFYQSRLGWTGTRWALRWYDGSVAIFRSCSPRGNDRCRSSRCEARPGSRLNTFAIPRTHALQTIRSGQAEIAIHYDDQNRIVRARGSHGQEVGYEYDARRAADPRGRIQAASFAATPTTAAALC